MESTIVMRSVSALKCYENNPRHNENAKIKERIIGRCLRWHECLMKKQRKQRLCIMTV